MTHNQLVASQIRKVREEKSYLQKDIADKLGVSEPSYSRIEAGKTPITIDLVYNLAKIFQVDINQLLNIENSTNIINSNNDNIFTQIGSNHSLTLALSKDDIIELAEFFKKKKQ